MTKKYVYSFYEGSREMKNLLGIKGANLAEMTKLGLPVPFGFTISTEACNKYYEEGRKIDEELVSEIFEKMEDLEKVTGKKFGSTENPLLVSVRSGAVYSMPGMMDTILNLGLNDDTVVSLGKITENDRFAFDSYRRFIQKYSYVVYGISMPEFNLIFRKQKRKAGVRFDEELSCEDLQQVIEEYKQLVCKKTGRQFPQDPKVQLFEAVKSIFDSWNNERATLYRQINNIPNNLGTAVNVQSMVFGNMGSTSCTGVAFTRNPATGEKGLFGEFMRNAQGEDIVAGIRTPRGIDQMSKYFPGIYDRFEKIAKILEKHYKDMQDLEFTVENNKLYMLQTRVAKRTAASAVKVAVDMVKEELITREEAVDRIDTEQIDQLLHPAFDAEAEERAEVIAKGLPASPGAAWGQICFTAESAQKRAAGGRQIILVRQETSPEDLPGMVAAIGILTARGGMTSQAAVVARGMGKCCISSCEKIDIDEEHKVLTVGDYVFSEGDYISLNGSTGTVYNGKVKTVPTSISDDFATIMEWSDDIRTLKIRANAESLVDTRQAKEFGAEGIGLCRTEHMFFEENRLPAMRQMIMAETEEDRKAALDKLLPFQKADFKAIYEVMEDNPVTIRLLDPPLHEFLPKNNEEMEQLSEVSGVTTEKLQTIIKDLHEFNPMLGHRGCRLVVTYPEIARMQTRAIIEAAIEIRREKGYKIVPEIMIPLVGNVRELSYVKKIVTDTIRECFDNLLNEDESPLEYQIGTMIEVPRAALTADEIAKEADFFSFGTNDLTQMTLGFSRDDTAGLVKDYIEKGIFDNDPFQTIDQVGVGGLVKTAISLGKHEKPNMKMGICGEHGGDPASIEFCHRIGLQYVSCSPFRVPVARLAAAQAAMRNRKEN